MQDEKKTAVFAVRMRPSVKAAGEKAAAEANRSLSSLMETLLIEHLESRGLLKGRGRKK
jgi:hypothetical protein